MKNRKPQHGKKPAHARENEVKPPYIKKQTPRFSEKKARKPSPPAKPAEKPHRDGILIWGVHASREALLNPKRKCFRIWLTDAGKDSFGENVNVARESGLIRPSPAIVSKDELDGILPPNSVHQGVALEVSPLPETHLHEILQVDEPPDLIVVLDQVTDPHNVGAILRSAAAFGAGAVIMTERNAPSTTGVMAKTASGAAEHVPQIQVVNLARALVELQESGYWCVGLAEEGERNLHEIDLSGKTALVLGAEGGGLRRLTREHCDELARLPTGGAIATLNVSNAAAAALYEARKQKIRFDAK